jgi:transketolase
MKRMSGRQIRKVILDQSKRAHVGHIGSALSIADVLACLYGNILRAKSRDDPDRDRFILSKGHAALALYAAFFLKGWVNEEMLNSFHSDGTLLGVHPEHALPGVDFSTGSLGHGLSFGIGSALAARMQGSSRHIFVLISDAECNAGSTWEAVMFAAHHRLSNLTAIIDLNGQQALGYTKDVLSLPEMVKRWTSFGWEAREVNGHDDDALRETLGERSPDRSGPRVIVARTVFGKGVSFMENQIKWHYLPMSDEDYRLAMEEIG